MYYLPALINGKAHEHSDIQVVIMGQMITGFTSIEYEDNQDIQNGHAAGPHPNFRTHGKINPSCKMSFLMSTLEAFQALVPLTRRIQEIPEFDIIVTYVDSAYVTRVHVLKNARFKNNGRKAGVGDGAIISDVEVVISEVQYKS
jgi:hypothetical protein